MNKYQEAYARIFDAFEHNKLTELKNFHILHELVDKATPKKVKKATKETYMETGYKNCCAACGNMVGTITNDLDIEHDDYCCSCGQALDWSEEE